MKKFPVKRFLIVFFILLLTQFLVGLADIFNQSENEFSSVINMLMAVFSMPIGLIHKGLPFYVNEPLLIRAIFWVINVLIQTFLILGSISLLRRVREKLKY
ncbi:hypothetical protein [Winogradskyella flava]|uniref:Uncharacterized protein n=1 Tax=Winogradskyella flava TaxID=1884876 RepID=A0A842ITM8_9FLAO|nr:hypothetical protein [Winogradskyella flava]MBC2846125.1 hypothetical protein [Winogradskyella flava]